VAAALAGGVALSALGEPNDPEGPVTLPRLSPAEESAGTGEEADDGEHHGYVLVARVLSIDSYGNVALNATGQVFGQRAKRGALVVLEVGGEHREVAIGATFGDVAEGELVVYADARGQLAVAVNGGSAAERLGIQVDDVAKLHFR